MLLRAPLNSQKIVTNSKWHPVPFPILVNATKEKEMMLEFFQLVNKKNALIRYESELVIR